jgi:hypothetical protein
MSTGTRAKEKKNPERVEGDAGEPARPYRSFDPDGGFNISCLCSSFYTYAAEW